MLRLIMDRTNRTNEKIIRLSHIQIFSYVEAKKQCQQPKKMQEIQCDAAYCKCIQMP